MNTQLLLCSLHAEADAFFCFVELLSGFRDFYCQQLDNSVVGIRSAITRLSQLVRKHDEELWRHLEITTKVRHWFFLSLMSFCCDNNHICHSTTIVLMICFVRKINSNDPLSLLCILVLLSIT